jgi:hypothetical protein
MKHPLLIPYIRVGGVAIAALYLLVIFWRHEFDHQRLLDSAMSLPIINSVNGYQFELIAPTELTIPQPGQKSQQFKMGLKITNNTAHARYFCLCAAELKATNRYGLPLAAVDVDYIHEVAMDRRDNQLILPGKSVMYEGDASLSSDADGIELSFFNPGREGYIYRVPDAGEYRISFNYVDRRVREWPTEIHKGKVIRSAIANIWTGRITTPAKTIKLVNAQ